MAPRKSMDAAQLKEAMLAYRDALKAHQEAINRLNVYPVPDGDTGTNMALTLEAVASELEAAPPSMAEVCSAVAHGSLMGARGNSGVILSQLLRGACQVLSPLASVGPRDLARALAEASRAADQAVMRPVEGTILTVARRAAEEATAAAAEGAGLVELLERTRKAAAEALAATPEMLAALKQAGVVDAGGAGFVLLVDALLFVADGRPLPAPEPQPAPVPARAPEAGGVGALRYEVTFLLEA
ncbi:MAG TPA: DAK2 domain-containing protein, partial [Acidimicrobiales bacterium]|nr:DAK2 domain-containing protein [Acidimicrobiales bacterium]